MTAIEVIQDGFFAAIAAIGFAAISRPPVRAFGYCAFIAAVGHAIRFVLMHLQGVEIGILLASTIASFVIGCLAVLFSPWAKLPAETFLFPSLLPMIPGVYAYRCFGGLVMCLLHTSQPEFQHYFYLFSSNGLTCLFTLLGMVLGASLPIFIFKQTTFTATRF